MRNPSRNKRTLGSGTRAHQDQPNSFRDVHKDKQFNPERTKPRAQPGPSPGPAQSLAQSPVPPSSKPGSAQPSQAQSPTWPGPKPSPAQSSTQPKGRANPKVQPGWVGPDVLAGSNHRKTPDLNALLYCMASSRARSTHPGKGVRCTKQRANCFH